MDLRKRIELLEMVSPLPMSEDQLEQLRDKLCQELQDICDRYLKMDPEMWPPPEKMSVKTRFALGLMTTGEIPEPPDPSLDKKSLHYQRAEIAHDLYKFMVEMEEQGIVVSVTP